MKEIYIRFASPRGILGALGSGIALELLTTATQEFPKLQNRFVLPVLAPH